MKPIMIPIFYITLFFSIDYYIELNHIDIPLFVNILIKLVVLFIILFIFSFNPSKVKMDPWHDEIEKFINK